MYVEWEQFGSFSLAVDTHRGLSNSAGYRLRAGRSSSMPWFFHSAARRCEHFRRWTTDATAAMTSKGPQRTMADCDSPAIFFCRAGLLPGVRDGHASGSSTRSGRHDGNATGFIAFTIARYPAERIVLWGESLGSALALAMAAENPVGHIVLEAPSPRPLMSARSITGSCRCGFS
jgi:pimeloyl-ACP methyl ester carboxylesterase